MVNLRTGRGSAYKQHYTEYDANGNWLPAKHINAALFRKNGRHRATKEDKIKTATEQLAKSRRRIQAKYKH